MTNFSNKLKVAVCGSRGVGKSAVTVRYLTKRFIYEYSSLKDFLYKHSVQFEDSMSTEIEILDTCNSLNNLSEHLRWADSFLIVYSIVDRESFYEAEQILKRLVKIKLPSYYSIILVGNKSDLEHSRAVSADEAQNLCLLFNCQFYEVSAAEGCSGINLAFHSLLKEARSAILQRSLPIRRKLGVNSVSKALGNIFGKNSKSDRKRPSLSI